MLLTEDGHINIEKVKQLNEEELKEKKKLGILDGE